MIGYDGLSDGAAVRGHPRSSEASCGSTEAVNPISHSLLSLPLIAQRIISYQ